MADEKDPFAHWLLGEALDRAKAAAEGRRWSRPEALFDDDGSLADDNADGDGDGVPQRAVRGERESDAMKAAREAALAARERERAQTLAAERLFIDFMRVIDRSEPDQLVDVRPLQSSCANVVQTM